MKIDCKVTGVEEHADRSGVGKVLVIRLKGRPRQLAGWRLQEFQSITVSDGVGARRSFYVGRKVEIAVRAK